MPNMTLTFDSNIEFVAVMNEDFYQNLSEAKRGVVDRCAQQVEAELRNNVLQIDAETLEFLRDKMNVIELTAAERVQWRDATTSVVDRFIENGGDTAAAVIKAAR